jgi:G3E family GTPase
MRRPSRHNKNMKTTVVAGLLGAGKTTFIQNSIRTGSGKVVVLVNDFGAAGIDGEVLSADGIDTVELPSGCICCTLKSDLVTSIARIMKDFSPDRLMIEPSGIASPSGVLDALDILNISPVTVVGIVDATEFYELYEAEIYGSFFEDQVAVSDIILINKVDLVSEESISRTVGLIESLNPNALLVRTVNATLEAPAEIISRKKPVNNLSPHLHFSTISLKPVGKPGLDAVKRFFDNLAKGTFGNVVRAKALLETEKGPFRFDLSYGKIDVLPFAPVSENRIVVIGEELKEEALRGLWVFNPQGYD